MDFEAQSDWLTVIAQRIAPTPEESKRLYHVLLLTDQGFVARVDQHCFRLTAQGHDYLSAIRDEGIWARTKAAVAQEGGSATLAILRDLATGFLRKQISDRTGIQL
jgi:hypothetical protein